MLGLFLKNYHYFLYVLMTSCLCALLPWALQIPRTLQRSDSWERQPDTEHCWCFSGKTKCFLLWKESLPPTEKDNGSALGLLWPPWAQSLEKSTACRCGLPSHGAAGKTNGGSLLTGWSEDADFTYTYEVTVVEPFSVSALLLFPLMSPFVLRFITSQLKSWEFFSSLGVGSREVIILFTMSSMPWIFFHSSQRLCFLKFKN